MPADVSRGDITRFLADLGKTGVTGVSRARKLAAFREFFRLLHIEGHIDASPTVGVETPKKERPLRHYYLPDEYNRMLALAGANPRDHTILTLFLQTGIRVSELEAIRVEDLDLSAKRLRVRGKGMAEREIELEHKAHQAAKNWLSVRPPSIYAQLFLNCNHQPLGVRGIRKLVTRYRDQAGIKKWTWPTRTPAK